MPDGIEKRTRANGKTSYRARVDLPPNPATGERRQRSKTFPTLKAAQAWRHQQMTEIERGTFVETSTTTVAELMKDWLETVAKLRVRPTTYEDYEVTVRRHIVARIGNLAVQKLTAQRVQRYYADMIADGCSAYVVFHCHQRLSQALDQAVVWNIIRANPCKGVTPPRPVQRKMTTWNAEQCRRFLDAAESDTLHPLWLMLVTTGLRRGEALGLRWSDIDFDRKTLTVLQAIAALYGAPVIQAPKTTAGVRPVRMPAVLVEQLERHRARQQDVRSAAGDLWEANDLVFATQIGTPINPNNLTRSYNIIVERAGLPRIRLHDLRHTHVTLLLSNQVPAKVVSERIGHASTKTTLDIYQHVSEEMQQGAADVIDQLVGRRT